MAKNNVSSYVYDKEAPNLFGLIDKFDADEKAKDAAAKAEAEARGKEISKMLDYNPSEVWGEYDKEIRQEYENRYVDHVTKMWADGRTPTTEDYAELAKIKNGIEGDVSYYNGYKKNFENTMKTMTSGEEAKYYNTEAVNRYFGGISYDKNGKKRSRNELTNEAVDNVYNQREIYNSDEIWKGFVSNFGKSTYSEYSREYGGLMKDNVEISKIFVMDGNKPDRDDEGNLKLKPSKEAFAAAMEDPMVRKQIEFTKEDMIAETGNEDITNFEAFQSRISSYSSEKETSSHVRDLKTTSSKKNEITDDDYLLRKKVIADIQSGSKEAIRELIGAKSGDRYIRSATWNSTKGGIDVTYKDDESEFIPSADFMRINNIYQSIPGKKKLDENKMATIPAVPKLTPPVQDENKVNSDVSVIITSPVKKGEDNYKPGNFKKGKELLESIPGVEKVEYKKQLTGIPGFREESYTGVVSLIMDGIEEKIDLFTKEGAQRIKEILLERKTDSYMTTSSSGVGSKYNK